ncbi:MAG: hypothetical protein AB9872_14725 [Solidesulfovibrio sp.]
MGKQDAGLAKKQGLAFPLAGRLTFVLRLLVGPVLNYSLFNRKISLFGPTTTGFSSLNLVMVEKEA